MKIVTLIIWLFCYNLFAIDDYYPIKVLDTGKTTSLKNIIYQYDEIEELVKSMRYSFEKTSDYKKRMLINKKQQEVFLEKQYKIITKPDKVKLDWENLILQLYIYFPLNVIQDRFNKEKNFLMIPLVLDENTIRELYTFKDYIEITIVFKIDILKNIVILSKGVMYNGTKYK